MMLRPFSVLLILLLVTALLLPAKVLSSHPADASAGTRLLFIENVGQFDPAARFQVWGHGQMNWLAKDAIWITVVSRQVDKETRVQAPDRTAPPFPCPRGPCLPDSPELQRGANIRLSFVGANPDLRIEPFDPLTTTVSYFLGNDPGKWRPAVPVYGGVRYVDLYPGVDLVLGGADATWELVARPGAEVSAMHLRIEGADGALLDGDKLRLTTAAGDMDLAPPATNIALQAEVVGADGHLATFDLQPASLPAARSDALQALADDPSDLIYSTYLGGSSWDQVNAIAVDGGGQATVAGITKLSTFPTTPGAYDPGYNGGDHDAFIARLSADGSTLVYSTFLGGSGEGSDWPDDIALDSTGQATVSGSTPSGDFPTTPGAYDSTHGGGTQPFVTRLSAGGSALIFSTFFDGPVDAIALDHAGQTVMAGVAVSSSFPTTPGAYDRTFGGGTCGASPSTYPCPDAFVARLSADGKTLAYSTFLGGSGSDSATAVAVDNADRISVAGATSSDDFPTTPGAYARAYHAGAICGTPPATPYPCPDAFIARLSADGKSLIYGTYLGGGKSDSVTDIAVATDAGLVTVTGNTASDDFPTSAGAFDPSFNGSGGIGWSRWDDAFVARLSGDGSLIYSTYLGGARGDESNALAVDSAGRAVVTGLTNSSDFPTTPGAFDTSHSGSSYDLDVFITRLSADGRALSYGTYLGGRQSDRGYALALDSQGRAFAAGMTASNEFPTTPGAFSTAAYGIAGFVSKLDLYVPDVIAPVERPGPGANIIGTVNLSGFAIDLASAASTGIDGVDIYLDGPSGTGALIGHATYGLGRPDVAARYGARFGPSGWELAWDTTGLAPGAHWLYLNAHRTTDGAWSELPPRLVIVPRGHVVWLPVLLR